MTADELTREVRRRIILDARSANVFVSDAEMRREYLAERRKSRVRLRELCRSKAFRNLAQGYSAVSRDNVVAGAGELTVVDDAILTAIAVKELHNLIIWLTKLRPIVCDTPPMQLLARADKQRQLRQDQIHRLREIASTVAAKYASRLKAIVREMEIDDSLALQDDHDVNFYGLANPKYIGHSGSASTNAEGAWRGLFIREMRSRLPDLDLIPQPYATMAKLLTWAGIERVSSPLVRSILKSGNS